MRHRVKKTIFSRDTKHRKALIRNGVRNLILHGEIETTRAKAKEIQRWADKLIHRAQEDTVATRRTLHSFFGKRDMVNLLVDSVAPVFTERTSGFTRISYVGSRRGDNTDLVKLELIKQPEKDGSIDTAVTEDKSKKQK